MGGLGTVDPGGDLTEMVLLRFSIRKSGKKPQRNQRAEDPKLSAVISLLFWFQEAYIEASIFLGGRGTIHYYYSGVLFIQVVAWKHGILGGGATHINWFYHFVS